MKKKYLMILNILLIGLLFWPATQVFADVDAHLYFCEQEGVITVFRFGGYALFIAKILVPLLIIIMGTIDVAKAMVANSSDDLQKNIKVLVKRVIAGVVIFFIPTMVATAFGLIENYAGVELKFRQCTNCLLRTGNCP